MAPTQQQAIDSLVEELRSTGYHGRELWLTTIDRTLGMAIATLRQLEVCGEQMASAWLDGEMTDEETWRFLRLSFLPRMQCLANRMDDATFTLATIEESRRALLVGAWHGAKRLIDGMERGDVEIVDCGGTVLSLLVAVMALRQLAEREAGQGNVGDVFVLSSTNVAPAFLARCLNRLRWAPFFVASDSSLRQLAQLICKLPEARVPVCPIGERPPTADFASKRSA